MDNFLLETKYCDFSHPSIRVLRKRFLSRYSDKKSLAIAAFYYVRDHIHYRVGDWTRTASQTLHERFGTCTNSANLFIAICRACDIPAGYGIMKVSGREYFGPIAPKFLSKFVSKRSTHVYAYVYLNDRWIKCDPSDDELLSLNTDHINPQSHMVEWNGNDDATLNLDKEHILEDKGPLDNIDASIAKKMRIALYFPVKIANLYLRFLRQHGSNISDMEQLEVNFAIWLRERHKLLFIIYRILALVR